MNKPSSSRLLDPRGLRRQVLIELARRVDMGTLQEGPVLLFDNTKLAFGNYAVIFEQLKTRLAERGVGNLIEDRETVRGKSSDDLKALGARLARHKPVACIIALADMGVAPATTVLTMALEELGIPTVYITAPPGTDLAKATAFYRAGRLCLSSLDIRQDSTADDIRNQTDKEFGDILAALTLGPQDIDQRAKLDFALDQDVIDAGGYLDLDLDITDSQAVTETFNEMRIGDGFPVIPPTEARYQAMMAYCPHPADYAIAYGIGPSGRDITVRDIAVNAVLAGCRPTHMPLLIAVFQAMARPGYNFLQSVSTAHPGGDMVLVSGPLAAELEIAGGPGCFGPGFPANACIGRAVKLVQLNVSRAIPGISDLAGLSSPAEFSFCFAEREPSPWPYLCEERGEKGETLVYVLKAEPPHDIADLLSQTASELMVTLVDSCTTLGSNNAYIPGPLVLVLTPDHANILANDGWDKQKIRQFLHAHVHHPKALLDKRGIVPVRPEHLADADPMPVTRSAEDIEIVVAGARGGHSAVIIPWALHSEGIVQAITLPDGRTPVSIDDFRTFI